MADRNSSVGSLLHVIDEVRATFHVLKAAAESVHGEGERSAARRGVLLDLDSNGPRTVPQIARSRPVSRQHIQVVVNSLMEDGLVEAVANPKHKRSKLIRLTQRGRQRIRQLRNTEKELLERLDVDVSDHQLDRAADVLAELRKAFARQMI